MLRNTDRRKIDDLYIFDMAFLFLLLLFSGMGLGDMLCLCIEGKVGQQGIYGRAVSPDLWFRCDCRTDFYAAVSNECGLGVSCGNDECDTVRIFYRRGDGEDVSCAVLGLQQPASESQWPYLCDLVAGMGSIFCNSYIVWTYAD